MGATLVGAKYVRVAQEGATEPTGDMCKFISCAKVGCGAQLTTAEQCLDMRRVWDLGQGLEGAGYYNSLREGSFQEGGITRHDLAHGPMVCGAFPR